MRPRIDLTGQTFTRGTVICPAPWKQNSSILWWCACICGNKFTATATNLKTGRIKSCGCLRLEALKARGASLKIHGHSYIQGKMSPTYNSWRGAIDRTTNKNHPSYKNYGARGIIVCERWRTFANFLEDMGEKPHGLTLERNNNDGNYEPSNCRWATRKEQRANRRPEKPRSK